jgi:hypothetical protein
MIPSIPAVVPSIPAASPSTVVAKTSFAARGEERSTPFRIADERGLIDRRRSGAHALDGTRALEQGAKILDPAVVHPEQIEMCRPLQDPVLNLAAEAGGDRQRDDERGDADGDPGDGDRGQDRDGRLPPRGAQVAQGDEELIGHRVARHFIRRRPLPRRPSFPGACAGRG